MEVQTYVFFDGRCDEALDFYRTALGAEVTSLMRFREGPDQSMVTPGSEDKVMHGTVRIGQTTLLVSDGLCQGQPSFKGFALTIAVPDAPEAERLFAILSDGGQVQMPMTETFFSKRFGMAADRFGVSWMVVVAP